jgi:predicted phosphodiesterase
VFGNNDVERELLGAACAQHGHVFVDPPLRVEWAGRRIAVVHDPRELDALDLFGIDVALYGHDHRHALERRGGALCFNPGECAGHLPGHNRIGVLDLATLEAEILRF